VVRVVVEIRITMVVLVHLVKGLLESEAQLSLKEQLQSAVAVAELEL
jgi:hypothetical protein